MKYQVVFICITLIAKNSDLKKKKVCSTRVLDPFGVEFVQGKMISFPDFHFIPFLHCALLVSMSNSCGCMSVGFCVGLQLHSANQRLFFCASAILLTLL